MLQNAVLQLSVIYVVIIDTVVLWVKIRMYDVLCCLTACCFFQLVSLLCYHINIPSFFSLFVCFVCLFLNFCFCCKIY